MAATYLGDSVPELNPSGPTRAVRVPDQHDIPLTPRVLAVIDHPAFQRLRSVRQLGPTHLVYPGAVHTRFEHALGVFGAARAYLMRLSRLEAFRDRVTDEDRLTLLAAALLHDLGHYPMAHSLEALHLKGNDTPRHEDIAASLIRGDLASWRGGDTIGAVLEGAWGVDPERVIALFCVSPRHHTRDVDAMLASIVSGALDADKMDYLERDSVHMGVPYGRTYDRERLLANLTVSGDGRALALRSKGKTPAEIFTFGRYMMFSEAYWHHAVRAASAMVEAALSDLQRRDVLPPDRAALTETLLRLSDDAFLAHLVELAPAGSAAARLLRGLTGWRRGLYKRLLTLNRIDGEPVLARAYARLIQMDAPELGAAAEAMRAGLNARFGLALEPGDLIIDTPPRDKDRWEDIEVVFSGPLARRRPLSQVSAIVRGIAGDFVSVVKKTRVFVAPAAAEALRDRADTVEAFLLDLILGLPGEDATP